jgi:hypothetical protein
MRRGCAVSTVDDLITWLRAQLDEDERVAWAAQQSRPGPWGIRSDSVGAPEIYSISRDDERGSDSNVFPDAWHRQASTHAIRWDPARVLAKVKADRRVLELAIELQEHEGRYAEDFLIALVQPYAGRPGWREEWRA